MESIYTEKIKVGMSACMYGAKVRYNGKGLEMLGYLKREKADYIWTPICPEVMSGMGVPRSPIRLLKGNGQDFWLGNARVKNRNGRDVTSMMERGALACYETLQRAEVDAYIFMEGSPSCGVYRTTLRNERLGKPPGVFGALLLNRGFFLIPAQDLQSPVKWWDWRRRLTAFVWLKKQEVNSSGELYKVWHVLKFLCQELDEVEARELGHRIANFSKDVIQDELLEVKDKILNMLRKPSDVKKVKQWLWKNYAYLKKTKGLNVEEVCPPEILRNMTHIAEEMVLVERETREKELIFGSSPINYRPSR